MHKVFHEKKNRLSHKKTMLKQAVLLGENKLYSKQFYQID